MTVKGKLTTITDLTALRFDNHRDFAMMMISPVIANNIMTSATEAL